MRSRAVALALVIATAGAMAVVAPAGASGSQKPAGFGEPDQVLVTELMGQGLAEGEAVFLALTKVGVRAVGDRRVRLTEVYPSGNRAVINVSVVPAASGPDLPKVKSRVSGGDFVFSLRYFVSYDAIPVDARVGIGQPVAGYRRATRVPTAESSGVLVVVKSVVKKFVTDEVSAATKELNGLGYPTPDKLFKSLKAGLSVADALALGAEVDAYMRQIDSLERCAKHPTNPLTKKANKENPAELQRILQQIAETRDQINANTAVGFVGMLNKTASGLIKNTAPWVGYVVGAGTAWSKDTLHQVNQGLIDDLKKAIVPCTNDYKIDGVVAGQRFTAIKCDGVAGKWDVTITTDDNSQYPSTGSWTFEAEPEDGGNVFTVSEEFGFTTATKFEQSYGASYFVTFYAGGTGEPPTPPMLGIDEPIGGSQIPVKVGTFCKK